MVDRHRPKQKNIIISIVQKENQTINEKYITYTLLIRKIESLNLDNLHVEQQYVVDQMIKTWIFPDFYTMTTLVLAIYYFLKSTYDFVFHF